MLVCSDVEREIEFCERVLGAEVVVRRPGAEFRRLMTQGMSRAENRKPAEAGWGEGRAGFGYQP